MRKFPPSAMFNFSLGVVLPIPTLPEVVAKYALVVVRRSPETSSLYDGAVVPMPTLPTGERIMFPLVVFLRVKSALVELIVKPPEVTLQVEAAAPVRFNAPADVRARVPDVAVDKVKFPEVLVQADVPPEAMVKAPVELPRVVVDPAPVE